MINPKTGTHEWYHSTPPERVEDILKDGLKTSATPVQQKKRAAVPGVFLSATPFKEEWPTFKVNTEDIHESKISLDGETEDRLAVRISEDIPANKISQR